MRLNEMRLYLSSCRLGSRPDRLLDLSRSAQRTALIPNALDGAPEGDRRAGLSRDLAELREVGLQVQIVDVRDGDAGAAFRSHDIVWVRGGNVFALRKALAEFQVDDLLAQLIRTDEIAYGGYSAGCAVLADDLSELRRVDDPGVVKHPLMIGLGVLDRPFVPHVGSPYHGEGAACDALSAAYTSAG